MIVGTVSAEFEAVIPVPLRAADGALTDVDAVLDTDYSGFLTLPRAHIEVLGLPWLCRQHGVLSDGGVRVFDVHTARVVWDGHPRTVAVEAVEGPPVVGIGLLEGFELRVQMVAGGYVVLEPLP